MKNNKFLITICAMVVAIIISITVVSCKKETQGNLMNNKNESVQTFNPREIEDMNAYLKGFKQKMQSATKGDDEALSLEDAAWHLSSLTNFEFGHANVECDDVRFDTLYAHVNITNGTVLLSDLAEAYQTVSSSIEKLYNGLALDNKHFRFINAFISENGEVTIPILTTFSYSSKDIVDNVWFFEDVWVLIDTCDHFFYSLTYPVQTTGTSVLQSALNVIVSQPVPGLGRVYYTKTSTKEFDYPDYIDPYGSPCLDNSRVFASLGTDDCDLQPMICYLFDSYLGLGHEYLPTGEYILGWAISYYNDYPNPPGHGHYNIEYHKLFVDYGIQHEITPEPGHNEND